MDGSIGAAERTRLGQSMELFGDWGLDLGWLRSFEALELRSVFPEAAKGARVCYSKLAATLGAQLAKSFVSAS